MKYSEIINELIDFRDKRGWKKYHNLKDLAIALNVEASELLEIFEWKNELSSKHEKEHLEGEIADILIYAFYICEKIDVDPLTLVYKKIKYNQKRHWNFDKEDSNE